MDDGEIIWISRKRWISHIYRNRPDGRPINPSYRGDWEVNNISAIDYKNEMIYFSAKKETETENHLYSLNSMVLDLKDLQKKKALIHHLFSNIKLFH